MEDLCKSLNKNIKNYLQGSIYIENEKQSCIKLSCMIPLKSKG